MSYTSVFGGTTIYPSDVSYLPLALAVDTTLEWPLEASGDITVAARIIGVTPASAGRSVIMPDATRTGTGQSVLFNNMGPTHSFLVKDDAGTILATVAPGTQWQVYLTDNTTAAGTWEVYQMGASTATVQASALAGPGLMVVGSELAQAALFAQFTTNLSPTVSNRATMYVYTGTGAATVTLPIISTVDDKYFIRVRNQGTGVLTLDPAGAALINGVTSINLAPEDSAMIICDGATNWYTVGLGQNAEFTFDFVAIPVSGGTYTLSGAQLNRIAYRFEGTLSSNQIIVVPNTVQQYWVDNRTQGNFTLGLKTASQVAPTLVAQNASAILYCDGQDVVIADTSGLGVPVGVAQGGTGATTPSGARANLGISPYADPLVTAIDASAAQSVLFPDPITDGQLLIGDAATPGFTQTTLTAGTGIVVTNGPGSVTIANTGSVYSVATRGAMAALDTTEFTVAFLYENGREGTFIWDGSDLSAEVAVDTAQGVYVPPVSNPTGAAGAWVRDIPGGEVQASWFGVIADGVTPNPTAFQAALTFCSLYGYRLIGDGPTRVPGGMRVVGGIMLDGVNDFTLLQGTEKGLTGGLGLEIAPSIGSPLTISAITNNLTIPAGTGYANTSRITLNSVTGLVAGDILFIRSDDAWSFASGSRKGELVEIATIDAVNNYVYTTSPVYHTYTTNPTARKLSDDKIEIGSGVTFSYDGDPYSVTTGNADRRIMALAITGAVNPILKCRFADDFSWSVTLFSCWRPLTNTRHERIRVNFDLGMIGVCVNIISATRGGWTEVFADKTGHAYDEGIWPTIAGSPIFDGAPLRNTCANSKATGTTVAAFNTHPGSFEPTFVNCYAEAGWTSDDTNDGGITSGSNVVGYQDRAFNAQWQNCNSTNMQSPITVSSQVIVYGMRNTPLFVGGSHTNDFSSSRGAVGLATRTTTDEWFCTFKNVNFVGCTPAQAAQSAVIHEYIDCSFASAAAYGLVRADNTGPMRFTRCTFRDFNIVRWGVNNNTELEDCLRINVYVLSIEPMMFSAPGTHTVDCLFKAASYASSALVTLSGTGAMTLRVGRLRSPNFTASTPITVGGGVTLTMGTYDQFQPPVRIGTTAQRPAPLGGQIGYRYLDTTLDPDGKPIWWNGTVWVDATGAVV